MIRSLLVISLTLALYAILSMIGPVAAPGRTLESNAVWSIFGGQTPDTCCAVPPGACPTAENGCDVPAGNPCTQRVLRDAHPVNREYCYTHLDGATCTQSEAFQECAIWKQCVPDGANCIPGQAVSTYSSPVTCNDDCP